MAIISIEEASKTFVTGRRLRHLFKLKETASLSKIRALNGITLSIPEGEFFGLMGPNGAGKTTLLKMLAGLVLPDRGRVAIQEQDVTAKREMRGLVGLVTGDERSFYWRLTGRQNLEFFASLYSIPSEIAKKRISELCVELGIENPKRPFQEYSTGLKQRFALARALLHDPPILLLDEPTKSLDPKAQGEFHSLVKKLVHHKKRTILYATHNLQEASLLFDRVGLLNKGELVKLGKWSEIEEAFIS